MQANGKQIIAIFMRKHDHMCILILFLTSLSRSIASSFLVNPMLHKLIFTDFRHFQCINLWDICFCCYAIHTNTRSTIHFKQYTGFSLLNLFQIVYSVRPSPHSFLFLYSEASNTVFFNTPVCSALQICANVFFCFAFSESHFLSLFFLQYWSFPCAHQLHNFKAYNKWFFFFRNFNTCAHRYLVCFCV